MIGVTGYPRITDETEHDMWIRVGVDWINCGRHAVDLHVRAVVVD